MSWKSLDQDTFTIAHTLNTATPNIYCGNQPPKCHSFTTVFVSTAKSRWFKRHRQHCRISAYCCHLVHHSSGFITGTVIAVVFWWKLWCTILFPEGLQHHTQCQVKYGPKIKLQEDQFRNSKNTAGLQRRHSFTRTKAEEPLTTGPVVTVSFSHVWRVTAAHLPIHRSWS